MKEALTNHAGFASFL